MIMTSEFCIFCFLFYLCIFFRVDHLRRDVNISLVGKYTKLEDSYASVTKALQHAAISAGYNLKLKVIFNAEFCIILLKIYIGGHHLLNMTC